jgi:iron complex transport system ATP-binding protein
MVMKSSSPIIEIKNLSFTYGDKTVLHDISVSIASGETWSIIGKNGVGKSTLIKCMAGLLPVKPDSVLIQGIDITRLKPRERAKLISYVPQAAMQSLVPYTVFDFVMLGRFPYQGLMAIPNDTDKKIVADACTLTDVENLLDRHMTTLSGGELQRVFLAGAVAQQSRIVLLDEPSTFLDPFHQEMIRKTLERIHKEFNTVIITITHDVNTAITNFTNVLALDHGALFFAGSTKDFRDRCPDVLKDIFSIQFEEARCKKSDRSIIVPGEIA